SMLYNENAPDQQTKYLAGVSGFLRWQQRDKVRGELKSVDCIRLRALIDRHVFQVGNEAIDQRFRLFFGPRLARYLLETRDRGVAFGSRLHESSQRVERLGVVAGHSGNRGDGCAAHFDGIGLLKEGLELRIKRGAKAGVANDRNSKHEVRELSRIGPGRLPDFVGGRISGDERRVTNLAGQRQLWFVRQFFQVGAPCGEVTSSGLEQQRG